VLKGQYPSSGDGDGYGEAYGDGYGEGETQPGSLAPSVELQYAMVNA
jgi:hypothetical protein